MELRQLRTMIAIADHQTFAAAAGAVCLSQSAVSQQVKALEDELGMSLFDRATRPPVLNVHGKMLVESARQIMDISEQVVGTISGRKLSGTLFLGAMRSCQVGVLPRALASLRLQYPDLHVRVASGRSDDLVVSVAGGRIDAAIVSGPIEVASGFTMSTFLNEPLMVVAPPGCSGRSDREVLEAYPFIRFERNVPVARMIESELVRRHIDVRTEMEIDSLQAIVLMVAHGLGVSVVPKLTIQDPFPIEVEALPFGDPPLSRPVGIIERVSNPKGHIVQALFEKLSQHSESQTESPMLNTIPA